MSDDTTLLENSDMSADKDGLKDMYLTFTVDKEEYGVPVQNVFSIQSVSPITAVPHIEPYIEGVFNLRGSIVPVVSARRRFMKPVIEYNELTCIIVVEYKGYTVGIVVDEVNQVMLIPEGKISFPPSAKLSFKNRYIKNIGKLESGIKLLIDIERFLLDESAG